MSQRFVVVGGGSAGSVIAARLTEDPGNQVVLLEAGPDFKPAETPEDILDTYAGRALGNPSYFWSDFKVKRGNTPHLRAIDREPIGYEQARVIGGGSSINGQVALRGVPDDFDRWERLGAKGWSWDSVLPYFTKLECDLDFSTNSHGRDGPIPIRRFFPEAWDPFSTAVAEEWRKAGFEYGPDMNAQFEDGYYPIPVSNDGERRVSTACGYLTDEVRLRKNLSIVSRCEVRRIGIVGGKAVGVDVRYDDGSTDFIDADHVVLSAGVFRTPWLLMRSGIGPSAHLRDRGVAPLVDSPGVGQNLQDHPMISISAFLPPNARNREAKRRNFVYLRYTSSLPEARKSDMIMMAVSRSSWHAVGQRIGTLGANLAYAYSRGGVCLPANLDDGPEVAFNWLSDRRDLERIDEAFCKMASILRTAGVSQFASHAFPSSYSARVRIIQQHTFKNEFLTKIGAALMDSIPLARGVLIDRFIREAPPLDYLLANRQEREAHLCRSIGTTFHPCGTCKMGSPDDKYSVVDPNGKVVGVDHLYIADASIMPEVTRTNTNIPVIMIAEKIADSLRNLGQ